MSSDHRPVLGVYGATSFTARELLRYLDAHPDGDAFELVLAGRNMKRLEEAAGKMKRQRELCVCDLNDEDSVKNLVGKIDVIVNLAGPFAKYNAEALIRECASTGKHYLDLCGERFFVGNIVIPKYDYLASTTGACIVPASGFDSVPSDMTMYYALRTLQETYPDATITTSRSFFNVRGGVSGGSFASVEYEAEHMSEYRGSGEWVMTSMHGKTPRPHWIYETTHPLLPKPLIGGFWFMYPFNRCVVRRSWFLSRLAPKAIGVPTSSDEDATRHKEPRHGDDLIYDETMQVPTKLWAATISLGITIIGIMFFASRLTRKLIIRMLPGAGDGPSEKKLKAGRLRLTNVSQTTQSGVSIVTKCQHDGDPGYIATNYMLAEAALSLLLPPPTGTNLPPLASKGGVLTPSTAFGMVLIVRLKRSGKVLWESELYDEHKN